MGVLSEPLGRLPLAIFRSWRELEPEWIRPPLPNERPATDILSLPRVNVTIETSNNEDWLDILTYHAYDFYDPNNPVLGDQLDLRGFFFDMHLRREPRDREIIVEATTINQRLSVGAEPNVGSLIIHVPESIMQIKMPGRYVGEIRASKGDFTRVIVSIELMLRLGITRLAFPR